LLISVETMIDPRSQITIVTAARSGKSEWAEILAARSGKAVVYLATSQRDPSDPEWQQRLALHQQRRPMDWQVREVPIALAQTLGEFNDRQCVLVDSLGTWLANVIEQTDAVWQQTEVELLQAIQTTAADLVFVSEETGWGVVPAYPIGRTFRDRLGRLTRRIARVSDRAYLVTAGYALDLQQLGTAVEEL
jgi:adenosylcobinamide kinase / adenosylcobinamide-phosphate guanylyltransferase